MNSAIAKFTVLFYLLNTSFFLKITAQNNVPFSKIISSEFKNAPHFDLNQNLFKEDHFDISTQSACPAPNDLPCGAVLVPLGAIATGSNICSGQSSEPDSSAQCIFGTINTVWFKVIVPASGSVRVRTHPLTLQDTQIEGFLFEGGCANAATNNNRLECNDDGIACLVGDGGYRDFSEQLFSGLTPDSILYIAVDGLSSQTGTFEITFIDGLTTEYPPVYQQDCLRPQIICSTNDIVVADPGFRNTGNICDVPGGLACWSIGERNSVWYQFSVDPALSAGTATISFDIFSNPSTDIDFIIWDVTGQTNACQAILNQNIFSTACNFFGVSSTTGLSSFGIPPSTLPYSPSIVFSGLPRTYLMLLNDFNNAGNASFTLDWGSTPISSPPPSAIWTGLSDTLFATTTNWGECGSIPNCGVDATINLSSNGRQPIITSGSTRSVKSIQINFGATLTLQANSILEVCGNFTNFGTLICNPGSTIKFIGNGLQNINGLLTGSNSFANLVVSKASGSVQLLNNIDIKENFTTSNANSIFNINSRYMKVGGNFTNFFGTTTFTGIGGSTVEFYNSSMQNFTNTNGNINLNRVIMNKLFGRVTLTGLNSIMNIDSTLTLKSGIITTSPSLEVNMKNNLLVAITGHNATSYIDGKLRRSISKGPGVSGYFDFPVGNLLFPGGYENAVVQFTSATTILNLLVTFNAWAAVPPLGPGPPECVIANYSLSPFLNNGYWTFTRSNAIFSGNYNITLYNTGFTNNIGSNGYSISKANYLSPPNLAASWGLLGVCAPGSTVDSTKRDQLNTANSDPTSFNHHYGTVQSIQRLPIELLFFSVELIEEEILCKWETASETNNDYFDIESSKNGSEFTAWGRVKGFGMGISSTTRRYSIVDNSYCDDIRYYRLKQVDIDGQYSYSDIVAVDCSRDKKSISVFPNPAKSTIFCSFYENKNSSVKLQWLDLLGKIVKEEVYDVVKGYNTVQSDVSDLAQGIYFLRIRESEKTSVENDRQIKFLMN